MLFYTKRILEVNNGQVIKKWKSLDEVYITHGDIDFKLDSCIYVNGSLWFRELVGLPLRNRKICNGIVPAGKRKRKEILCKDWPSYCSDFQLFSGFDLGDFDPNDFDLDDFEE